MLEALDWFPGPVVFTAKGKRQTEFASATPEFLEYWEDNKEDLEEEGIAVSEIDGEWRVSRRREPPKSDRMTRLKLSSALTTTIQAPCPLGREPLPFQHASVAYFEGLRTSLNGSDMGTGKTIMAPLLINRWEEKGESLKNILVVAPPP